MQLLSGHLMHQQVPMVFLLPLVYLGAVTYISVEVTNIEWPSQNVTFCELTQ